MVGPGNEFSFVFNSMFGSAQMETFSEKHRLQHFKPHLRGEAFLLIFHDRLSISKPLFFMSHTYIDDSVLFCKILHIYYMVF